jgi:hypothetical protein
MGPEQLAQMWEFLVDPAETHPPRELQEVSNLEWYLARQLLKDLLAERERSRVH